MPEPSPNPEPPELLAPAGNFECVRAAVANGADAVYFGLPRFNARLRADNFTEADLPEVMRFLHDRGVRGFVTMNTLIFTEELPAAAAQLRLLAEAGVDAIIVQDIGLARLARAVAPSLELHASTQMTITSPESLSLMNELGLDRAVLARELSLRELASFRDSQVPLEVFVHGALCVAYSGQCLTSESLGQRSANRGECAQACRMPYELVVDGETKSTGGRPYLLSPQDLAAIDEIPELVALGIRSFKIEGRLKSPEYVAAVTRVYRKAIDAALAGQTDTVTREDRYDLSMTFSRGLFPGWLHGVNHQRLVDGRFAKKRGPFAGQITATGRDWVELDRLGAGLKPGDGVVFDTGGDTNREQGGFIFAIHGRRLSFQNGRLRTHLIPPGSRVWKTSDPAMERRLRSSWQGNISPQRTIPLHLRLTGRTGSPLVIAESSGKASVTSEMPLAPAQRQPLTEAMAAAQLGRLGGSRWHLAGLDFAVEGSAMLPVSELNRLRRSLVAALEASEAPDSTSSAEARASDSRPPAEVLHGLLAPMAAARTASLPRTPELHVLCRSRAQLESAAHAGIHTLYLDLEDIRGYADAAAWIRDHSQSHIVLATPRIQKANEQGFFRLIERAQPHGVLIRNPGAVRFFSTTGLDCFGDFSLNVANPLTAEFYREQGLARLTISCDLNAPQVASLLLAAPPDWFELIIHQHMPMFHMEHCVFAAFLSEGSSFLDCGRPCDRHQVKLRDRVGMEHPLKADVGCRNTLFNAVAQTGARHFDDLRHAGLSHFRIDLLEESPEETTSIIAAYRALLHGQIHGEHLWQSLGAQSQLGVTAGTLRNS
jgi:putative protease